MGHNRQHWLTPDTVTPDPEGCNGCTTAQCYWGQDVVFSCSRADMSPAAMSVEVFKGRSVP